MTMERWIRLIAGAFVMASLALGYFVSPWFYLFTAFVGANLFQSALSGWCLMENILSALGVERCGESSQPEQRGV
jgi:H+/gluconate symporter-like permease